MIMTLQAGDKLIHSRMSRKCWHSSSHLVSLAVQGRRSSGYRVGRHCGIAGKPSRLGLSSGPTSASGPRKNHLGRFREAADR